MPLSGLPSSVVAETDFSSETGKYTLKLTLFYAQGQPPFALLDKPDSGGPVKFLMLLLLVLLRFSGRIGVLDRRLGAWRIRWS